MKMICSLGLALILVVAAPVHAEQLMMVRVRQSFPETMLKFQEVIKLHGYKLSRVQRVDIGLSKSGYQTDKYRVVFFGKTDQIHWLVAKHPELIPYLPLKVAIYAENEDTLLVSSNLDILLDVQDAKLKKIVHGWQHDMQLMFREMHKFGQNN